ncbi:hypothetical protein B0T21DRAFT_388811 [Apiosordaria backusii]|uniref:Uncharacterized protein n=1 Tax=Apiosordaria backusii TaxID=314023 RepID=A0AA40EYF1_9PEZI|nr:hypothetical protein B0T21DRAFT_388811 [Apiosordaria backusii]
MMPSLRRRRPGRAGRPLASVMDAGDGKRPEQQATFRPGVACVNSILGLWLYCCKRAFQPRRAMDASRKIQLSETIPAESAGERSVPVQDSGFTSLRHTSSGKQIGWLGAETEVREPFPCLAVGGEGRKAGRPDRSVTNRKQQLVARQGQGTLGCLAGAHRVEKGKTICAQPLETPTSERTTLDKSGLALGSAGDGSAAPMLGNATRLVESLKHNKEEAEMPPARQRALVKSRRSTGVYVLELGVPDTGAGTMETPVRGATWLGQDPNRWSGAAE